MTKLHFKNGWRTQEVAEFRTINCRKQRRWLNYASRTEGNEGRRPSSDLRTNQKKELIDFYRPEGRSYPTNTAIRNSLRLTGTIMRPQVRNHKLIFIYFSTPRSSVVSETQMQGRLQHFIGANRYAPDKLLFQHWCCTESGLRRSVEHRTAQCGKIREEAKAEECDKP